MLQTDASQANAGSPDARNDVDALPAGSNGPATGNVITAAGTLTSPAGADSGANVTVIAIQGEGGGAQISPAGSGPMTVQGRYGTLTIDAEGNYSYVRNAGSPDAAEDVFNYTIANAAGGRDSATLTILLGRENDGQPEPGTQTITTAQGVVVLPAGVELSDIRVVGRDLVITLPDGSTQVIPNGAVFVPQLVIGDVEVPPTNLAALLIDAEPQPASGTPQSSGGNFGVDVPPLDPGVPLGDLLPPTDFGFTPPVFEDVGQFIDREPEITIQPDGQPAAINAVDTVDESGLPARTINSVAESAGSNAASNSETTSGVINIDSPDGPNVVTIVDAGGVARVVVPGLVVQGQHGVLTIGTVSGSQITYSYTLTDNALHNGGDTAEDFSVSVTDDDGDVATATLHIDIIDDVPTARADVDSVSEDGSLVADGNVFTGIGGSDSNSTDGVADTQGADGAHVQGFTFGSAAGAFGAPLAGAYGSLVLTSNGGYTYTLNNGNAAVQALGVGETLTEVYSYTIVDGDGDTSTATLTITINGANDAPTVVNSATVISEEGLAGANADTVGVPSDDTNSATATGSVTFNDVDGDAVTASLGLPAGAYTSNGVPIVFSLSADGHTLTGAAAGSTVITVTIANSGAYTVTLSGAFDHPAAGVEDEFNLVVPVSANDGSATGNGTITIAIEDDSPIANDDAFTILEGDSDNAITFDVDLNDSNGADGFESRVFTSLNGTYGSITLNGDGTQTYTLNATGIAALNALAPGATLSDTFSYTLTDNDGDSDPATLVITLQGTDDPPLITNLTPALEGGEGIVDEDDLPDGSDTSKEALTVDGTFNISAPDGVDDLTVGGVVIVQNGVYVGGTVTTGLGNEIVFTGYNAATGELSYTYTLLDNEAHANGAGENSLFDSTSVVLTDTDGDTATDSLVVQVVDDVPTANDDAYTIFEGDSDNAITFDVDLNDVPGADGTQSRVFTSLTGTYGNITLNADGTQTYTLNALGIATLNGLSPNQTLTDTFNYTLTDGDNDSDPATVVITLQGQDDPPVITNLTPAAIGGEGLVDEDDLLASRGAGESAGSDTSKESTSLPGTFNVSAADGIDDLVVGGVTIISNGSYVGGTVTTPLGNQIVFTGFNAATGEVSYTYTLLDNEVHPNGGGENNLFDNVGVTLTDADGDTATDTLSVQIIDDVPTANDDAYTILEGDSDNAITFDVDLNDVPGADGTASRNFTSLTGTYGNIVLNGDGTQTYTLNATGIAALNALSPGATLTDTFTYTLTDGDNDSDPATVVITLQGTDDPPVITNLTPALSGGDAVVDEDDLLASRGAGESAGSDATKESTTVTGDFTISAPDGIDDLVVGGINVFVNGVFQVGASGSTPLGNTITFTGFNAATGVVSYSYTLLDNEAHANANGENDLFDDLAVSLTDVDGDIDTDTLSVRIIDDVPTANNDTIGQATENASVSINAFANDVFGADGVDIDNNPTVRVTFTQPPAGQGTVTYNPGTGLFTFTPAAGQQGSTSFTYTITDGDGDPSTATVTVNLLPDSAPQVVNVVAAVDDDALANGNPNGTGDLDANAGETIPPGDSSEAVFVGNIAVNFGGDTGTVDFSNLNNTFGTVGTEYVRYTWSGTTLTATVNATASDGTTAQARAGTVLYTVNLTPSGTYTVTLLDNVLHSNVAGENDATAVLNYRAADSDGDVNTTGTLTITFDDDTPEAFTTSAVQASNGNSAPVIGNLNLDMGADGLGSLAFDNSLDGDPAVDAGGRPLSLNGQPLFYQVNGNVLTAETAGGALGFTVTLNSNGTYTFDVNGTISNGTETSFTNLTSSAAGNVEFRGVGAGVANNNSANTDLLLSGHGETQASGTVNTDSDSIGVDSQAVNPGAGVRIDFVKNLNADTVAPINASGFTFDNHVTTTHFEQFIPQVQGSQDNRVNLVVTAILADEDQTFDNTPYNADGTNGVEAGESKVTITSVVINDYSDAAGGGTLGASYTFTLGQPDPAGAAAAGFDVTFVNGSVVIEGLKQNDQYEINTGSNFSAVVIESPGGPNNWLSTLDPHPEAGNQIANANDLDLGIISIGATGAGTPIVQTFPIIAVDGDGDQVSGSITTTINPVVAAAALPLAKVAPTADLAVVNDGLITDTDHTLKSMNAANNNAVLLGAVAAAGLVGSPAAAHDAVVDSSHLSIADFGVQGGAELAMPAMSIDRGEAVRSALLDGGREGAVDQALATQASGGHGNDMVAAAHGLAGQPQVEHSAPTELLQPMDMQAQAATQGFAPVADAVVMPSAEMLSLIADARSAVDGDGHGRDLGNVLSDALAGGHHGPSIDAIIEAVTGEARDNNLAVRSVQDAGANHAGTGADAGASHADAAVSGWDSAAFAGFTHAQAYSMEALAAHPDAAPAAHAG